MPSKRPPITTGEIYHIIIRAMEGLKLFREDKDYLRMIHDLFEFNDENIVGWQYRQNYGKRSRSIMEVKRKLLVEVMAFCLMPNHVHILVRQIKDGGISKFMRKIGVGYSAYYNKKYKRAGHVFQGRYKIVHISNDNQLKTAFVYIHTNPVAIICPNWKEEGIKIKDINIVIKFLKEEYRWSSYLDYLGNKNFPSLTIREWLIEEIGGVKELQRLVNDWLQAKQELADLDVVAIE